ncbi:MAG: 3-oxoacyl-[acyl-carrier-protein] synthase III C-terminal domain-containing protein [Rhodospirillaceae bacterium]|nr:3-oxoacyl-[acyl-carrier-protein] synthase III C-terminal domain-containing protein [Rhodospirillaceae bacterium]
MPVSTNIPIGLHGIATAYPPYRFGQEDVMAQAQAVFGHRPELMRRMMAAYGNAGVATRYSCVPIEWYARDHGWPERMALFESNALALLADAGRKAIAAAGISPEHIGATVTVSSTGISTPSLDSLLQAPLGLKPTVQRLPVFGLGCAGGVIGLSRAAALARATPGQWVLFMCTELCGLTFRRGDDSKANIIGTTIFGDGAAAIVLSAGERTSGGFAEIEAWGEHTWPGSRDVMGWSVEDDGLGVIFSRHIPTLVRDELRPVTDAFLRDHGLSVADLDGLIVHPGGEKVISAIEESFDLAPGSLTHARDILAECGNMSAVTVLAVLERMAAPGTNGGAKGRHLMSALGPGFSAGFCLMTLR